MDKRFLRVCLVIFLVGILVNVFSSPKSYVDKYNFKDCQVHIVKSGEILWTICEGYCPEEIDLREYIELVMEVSDKEDTKLMPGETVILPIIAEKEH